MLTEEEKKVLDEMIKNYRGSSKSIGRYKYWDLISRSSPVGKLLNNSEKKFETSKYINDKGFQIRTWRSLSYDSDDEGDYAFKKDCY